MITHTPLVAGNLPIKTLVAMAMANKYLYYSASVDCAVNAISWFPFVNNNIWPSIIVTNMHPVHHCYIVIRSIDSKGGNLILPLYLCCERSLTPSVLCITLVMHGHYDYHQGYTALTMWHNYWEGGCAHSYASLALPFSFCWHYSRVSLDGRSHWSSAASCFTPIEL